MDLFEKTIELSKEKNTTSINFAINNPRLWWVRNIGEPYLYEFRTQLIADYFFID